MFMGIRAWHGPSPSANSSGKNSGGESRQRLNYIQQFCCQVPKIISSSNQGSFQSMMNNDGKTPPADFMRICMQ